MSESNLYLISQDVNNEYDTYDSAIVCAKSVDDARMLHPHKGNDWDGKAQIHWDSWCGVEDVTVKLIGVAADGVDAGVVLASFNAG